MLKKKQLILEPKSAPQEKPTPTFLREDYPFKAIGDAFTELDSLEPSTVYEIKCPDCEMSIRSQGVNKKNIRAASGDWLHRLWKKGTDCP